MGSNPITLIMRYANHIILDFETSKNNQNSQYWVNNVINNNLTQPLFLTQVRILDELNSQQSTFNKMNSNSPNLNIFVQNPTLSQNNYLNTNLNLININFLRKEKLYTKLKYSRSPAYDIVSGGAAALFAGFLGFLVSEKFGFELVDSGDFYFLTMYIVFICFSVRPLLTTCEPNKSLWTVISLYNILNFYIDIISLFFRRFKS